MITRKFVSDKISGPALLSIESPDASVTITAVEGESVVRVKIFTEDPEDSSSAKSVQEATFGQDGNRVTVEVPSSQDNRGVTISGSASVVATGSRSVVFGSNNVFSGNFIGIATAQDSCGVQVQITVPVGTSIDSESTNGDLSTHGPLNEVAASVTNGSIAIEAVRAVKINSTNGSVRVTRATETVDIRSTNGRIAVEDYVGSDARARTTNGRIEFAIKQPATGRVELRSTNGSITVRGAHENRSVEVTTRTSNGSISNH